MDQQQTNVGAHPFPGVTWQKNLAWLLFGLTLVLSMAGFVLFILNRQTVLPPSFGSEYGARNTLNGWIAALVQNITASSLAAIVGVLIVTRRPDQRIGWLLMTIGLLSGLVAFLQEWALYGYFTLERDLPGVALVAWMTNWLWIPLFFLAMLMPALFPNGHFLSSRWARIISISLLLYTSSFFLSSALETPMSSAFQIPNPFFDGQSKTLYDILFFIGLTGLLCTVMLVLASVIARFRASQGRERQQIKWLFAGMALMALSVAVGFVLSLGLNSRFGEIMIYLSLFWPLLGIGVALLRYQLYDIDVIIRRTVTYTALTAVLALVYFGSIILLQTAFRAISGQESPLVIVISTLLIAALFSPLRSRLQQFIDRRFYRAKYDAARTLETFAQTARNEVELESLTAELLRVVEQTMRPESVSLWLKPGNGRDSGAKA